MRRGGERLGCWFLIGCVGLIVSRRKVDRRQFIQGLVDASFQKVTSCLLSLLTQKREREREREREKMFTHTHTHTHIPSDTRSCMHTPRTFALVVLLVGRTRKRPTGNCVCLLRTTWPTLNTTTWRKCRSLLPRLEHWPPHEQPNLFW